MNKPLNLRYELRAYEATNACRLASILQELTSQIKPAVARDKVVARWAELNPRHVSQTGDKSIRKRLSTALTLLKVAGIASADGSNIKVVNVDRLRLSAENLTIVEDRHGMAIPPLKWSRRPAVPQHLKIVQEPIEQQRLEDIAKSERKL